MRGIARYFKLSVVVVATPCRRRCCRATDIRVESKQTGSRTLPISGSRQSMTEDVAIGAWARTRLLSPSAAVAPIKIFDGGGICKGLYAFSCHVVNFTGSKSQVVTFSGVDEAHVGLKRLHVEAVGNLRGEYNRGDCKVDCGGVSKKEK